MFTEIYGQVTGWAQDATEEQQHFKLEFLPDEISVSDIKMNIKMFKMIFNRAIRVKSRDVKQGEKMFLYLVEQLAEILGTPNSYYAASLYFELVKTANGQGNNEQAQEYLEKGRRILMDHFGGDQSANYIDYYIRKIDLNVSLLYDQKNLSA